MRVLWIPVAGYVCALESFPAHFLSFQNKHEHALLQQSKRLECCHLTAAISLLGLTTCREILMTATGTQGRHCLGRTDRTAINLCAYQDDPQPPDSADVR